MIDNNYMKIPFTIEQFLGVFKDYNLSVYPSQIIFNIIAVLIVYYIVKIKILQNSFLFFWVFYGFGWE